MRRSKNLAALILGVLLVACAVAVYLTRGDSSPAAGRKLTATVSASLIDPRLLQTANQLSTMAETPEEQALAREGVRLTDHELDQAFVSALRETATLAAPGTGPLKQLADRIDSLKARVTAGQARIAALTKSAGTNDKAASQLELIKAQAALDEDELEDAQLDLARQGGDEHSRIERAMQEHQSAENAPAPKPASPGPTGTLSERLRVWLSLGDQSRQLDAARQFALSHAAILSREHDALEKMVTAKPGTAAAPPSIEAAGDEDVDPAESAAMVTRLLHLSDQRKTLADLGKRIQDTQQVADVHNRWSALLDSRRRGVLHLLLESVAEVLAILLAVLLFGRAVRRAFDRQTDRKRLHQLRVMATIAVQLAGAVVIVLIIFGPPNQTSTIIGLTTAGLTVVLKDFIVAFFGWFALMGRNGLHVGDWVEINGVSGEVIEIGVLKTVLLEMGNWTSTGHPTGRRVAFVNSFAIEGHYFNFSTTGQWLWDELQVALPATGDPYEAAQQIRQAVERETEADATAAEQDWQRVTNQYGMQGFSAKPAVDLRPSATGLTVLVRYITHAPQRYQVKSRLFETIVNLLHKPAAAAATPEKA